MNTARLQVLVTPGFLVGLSLLLLNDLVLKETYSNAFTGKLSDFAGLFVFPLFWAALLPRLRATLYFYTAILFLFWKSIHAGSLIDALNEVLPFSVGRTPDPTDLAALLVLPISYLYGSSYSSVKETARPGGPRRRPLAGPAVALISILAFTATTRTDDRIISYNKEYEFNVSSEDLIRELYDTGLRDVHSYVRSETLPRDEEFESYAGVLRNKLCRSEVIAYMDVIAREADRSVLELYRIEYRCDTATPEHERELLWEFERAVIDDLREEFGS